MSEDYNENLLDSIAIVGMACRFPKAQNIEEYWENLINGKECITFFSKNDALKAGANPEELDNKNYVTAGAFIEDIDMFDAELFGLSQREAEILDPQHRMFLECAWEALEQAGYCNTKSEILTGIFACSSFNTYLLYNIATNKDVLKTFGHMMIESYNSKDLMPSRLAYILNLKGPCVAVQNGCTSSLAAVHFAVQSLLNYQCDMALAGGASIRLYLNRGYLYQKGGMLSPDGHCRPFDEKAQGTVGGNGAGVVVLKRTKDALEDGDNIYAIIKGTSLTNDGSEKLSFTAPGTLGQIRSIRDVFDFSGVNPDSICMVEAQGTGTPMGDSLEVSILSQVFKEYTDRKNYCALGSVKANIGHLDVVSGMASMIKVILSLKNRIIPPQINFETPNPNIDFGNSPFYINTQPVELPDDEEPKRALVNNYGIGGCNVGIVLEEAPKIKKTNHNTGVSLIPISAQTEVSLNNNLKKFLNYLKNNSTDNLNDIAFTLQLGRQHLKHRIAFVSDSLKGLEEQIEYIIKNNMIPKRFYEETPEIAFAFLGDICIDYNQLCVMYNKVPLFKKYIDICSKKTLELYNYEVLELVSLNNEQYQSIICFCLEYSLANYMIEIGIKPSVVLGHGIGELTAANISGLINCYNALDFLHLYGTNVEGDVSKERTKVEILDKIRFSINNIISTDLNVKYYSTECGFLSEQNVNQWLNYLNKIFEDNKMQRTQRNCSIDVETDIVVYLTSSENELNFTNREYGVDNKLNLNLLQKSTQIYDCILNVISRLWAEGVEINWEKFNKNNKGRRIPLPTYSFFKKRYWIEDSLQLTNSQSTGHESFHLNDTCFIKTETVDNFVDIIRNLVGDDKINLNTNFRDLAISSFIGVQLLINIQQVYGVDLPIEVIYSDKTINEVYMLIKNYCSKNEKKTTAGTEAKTNKTEKIVTLDIIKEGENPFLCIAPLSGVFKEYNRDRFMPLIDNMEINNGFYCLNSPVLMGTKDSEVKDIYFRARECSELIINTITQKTLILGGWCNGGLLAFETAKQLISKGKTVELLILFDTYEQSYLSNLNKLDNAEGDVDRYDEILFIQSFLIEVDPENEKFRKNKIIEELNSLHRDEWLGYVRKKLQNVNGMTENLIKKIFEKYQKMYKNAVKKSKEVFENYKATEYDGKVILFKAVGDGNKDIDPYLGWSKIFKGEFIVHEVEGNHLTMLQEPQVRKIANLIDKYILDNGVINYDNY